MIILRQKIYSVDRFMARTKPINLEEYAQSMSEEKIKGKIRKINNQLGPESIQGRGGSIGGFFRGMEARKRVRMGYNTPEAIEKTRQRKIQQVLNDRSLKPEAILENAKKSGGQKIKEATQKAIEKTKSSASDFYRNTGKRMNDVAGLAANDPFYFTTWALGRAPGFFMPPAMNAAYQANPIGLSDILLAAGYGTGMLYGPIRKTIKIPTSDGNVIEKTVKIPIYKNRKQRQRKFLKKLDDKGIGNWSIKGGVDRARSGVRTVARTIGSVFKKPQPTTNTVPPNNPNNPTPLK